MTTPDDLIIYAKLNGYSPLAVVNRIANHSISVYSDELGYPTLVPTRMVVFPNSPLEGGRNAKR